MIIKPHEINNYLKTKNFYLFYGENRGQKEDLIEDNFKKKFKDSVYSYTEKEIIDNKENFYNQLITKSFFEAEKLIIINNITDKIRPEIEILLEKKIDDVTIILIADILEKKSKIRNFFEKDKNLVTIAFYKDKDNFLSDTIKIFFKKKNINVSQQIINEIIEKSSRDRKNLKNELEKIDNFISNKKKINLEEIQKLTNLSENYKINELVDNTLAQNTNRAIKILNENNYSIEDIIKIIRSFLIKSKRLIHLTTLKEQKKNIDQIILNSKPPIFWKDKEIVKIQIQKWSSKKVKKLILSINETELLIKKNSSNSMNILIDFIINLSTKTKN